MERQPIETAPRDGTKFLTLFLGEFIIAKWSEHVGRIDSPGGWIGLNVKWHDQRQSMVTLTDGWGMNGELTHWWPLPSPPDPSP